MPKGGKRKGAGRKPTKWGTGRPMRIPEAFWDRIKQLIEEMKISEDNS